MDSQSTPAPTQYLAYTLKTDKSAHELSAEAERLHPDDLSAQQRWLIEETSRIGWDVTSGMETTAVLKPHNNLRAETESFLSEIGITDYSFTPIGDLQIHSIPDDWHYERSENLTDNQLFLLDFIHRIYRPTNSLIDMQTTDLLNVDGKSVDEVLSKIKEHLLSLGDEAIGATNITLMAQVIFTRS